MKKLWLILMLSPLLSLAQKYSGIDQAPDRSSAELCASCAKWFALNFTSSITTDQLSDSVKKTFIGKGVRQVNYNVDIIPTYMNVHFILYVEFREGRYKYEIQSQEILSQNGKNYSYDQLEQMSTSQGLDSIYKSMGVRHKIAGKDVFSQHLASNKALILQINNEFEKIISDLSVCLKSPVKSDTW